MLLLWILYLTNIFKWTLTMICKWTMPIMITVHRTVIFRLRWCLWRFFIWIYLLPFSLKKYSMFLIVCNFGLWIKLFRSMTISKDIWMFITQNNTYSLYIARLFLRMIMGLLLLLSYIIFLINKFRILIAFILLFFLRLLFERIIEKSRNFMFFYLRIWFI
jgi:hypothetical protein